MNLGRTIAHLHVPAPVKEVAPTPAEEQREPAALSATRERDELDDLLVLIRDREGVWS